MEHPSSTRPVVTVALLVAVALVFLWQLWLGPRVGEAMIYALGLIPGVLLGRHELPTELTIVPPTATILTSMFMHGGWLHLLGNMLYLWIYGDNVEDAMGHGKFVLFYLLCGIAAALTQALPAPHSTVPMIGASGAISGVLGAYMLLFPRARVLVLIPLGFFLYTVRWPAAHWLEVFRTFYGPMHKAFGALDTAKQTALAADLFALSERFNRATDGSLVAPSEYFEVVITRG